MAKGGGGGGEAPRVALLCKGADNVVLERLAGEGGMKGGRQGGLRPPRLPLRHSHPLAPALPNFALPCTQNIRRPGAAGAPSSLPPPPWGWPTHLNHTHTSGGQALLEPTNAHLAAMSGAGFRTLVVASKSLRCAAVTLVCACVRVSRVGGALRRAARSPCWPPIFRRV